jgi:hypothetical protein
MGGAGAELAIVGHFDLDEVRLHARFGKLGKRKCKAQSPE